MRFLEFLSYLFTDRPFIGISLVFFVAAFITAILGHSIVAIVCLGIGFFLNVVQIITS
jgi:hypothetical protein